jgi:hypothetical protein
MAAVIRPNFHHTMAESIYEKIQNKSANYHYYLGKVLPWVGEGSIADAPALTNHFVTENDSRKNIVAVKQISINDVSFITRRIDWQSNTVYDKYDDIYTNPRDRNFYVLTEDFNVYKCIDNNNGAASTVKPIGTDIGYTGPSADGYIWKFMYFIPLSLRNKFLTTAYMPVIKQVKNQYYSAGTISGYVINDSGQDYDPNETYAVVQGDGADADIDLVIEDGQIVGLIINNAGIGYTTATLSVTKGALDPGEGADIDLTLSAPGDLDSLQSDVESLTVAGEISSITVTASNNGYTSAPAVTITGDGTGAAATAVIDVNGKVTSITMTNRGSGYTFATVSVAPEGLITTTARAIIAPQGGHGFNAPRELIADTLSFYSTFENELNQGLTVNNQFRQFGIIKDIDRYGATRKYINAAGTACFLVEGTLVGDSFAEDANIHTTGDAKVLRTISSEDNKLLIQSVNKDVPEIGDVFYNVAETANFTVTNVVEPTIDKYSGEILFIDNRLAFTSSEEQSVVFRTFIKF